MPLPMQNYDEAKRNATFMTMRAAQKTAQKNGQAWMGEAPKTSRNQRAESCHRNRNCCGGCSAGDSVCTAHNLRLRKMQEGSS